LRFALTIYRRLDSSNIVLPWYRSTVAFLINSSVLLLFSPQFKNMGFKAGKRRSYAIHCNSPIVKDRRSNIVNKLLGTINDSLTLRVETNWYSDFRTFNVFKLICCFQERMQMFRNRWVYAGWGQAITVCFPKLEPSNRTGSRGKFRFRFALCLKLQYIKVYRY
jgi:hypothetical protein